MRSLFTCCLVTLMLCSPLLCHAQQLGREDMALIGASQRKPGTLGERNVRYGFTTGKQSINPFYHILSSGMYIYQRCISPVIARSCAYSPSCSGYSKALIKEYGLLKGSVCTADRLMRCNRISLADPATYRMIDSRDGHVHESVDRYKKK